MYDYVFITHLPSFYKINLYNELAKEMNIYVFFIGSTSKIRTKDFVSGAKNFDHEVLCYGNFEERNKFVTTYKLVNSMRKLSYKKIVVGGWDQFEFWASVLLNHKEKNGIVLESTLLESNLKGIKGYLKKMFVNRLSLAFPSGQLHKELLFHLGYKGEYYLTQGVGIFLREDYKILNKSYEKKCLYVGRLSEEKNLFYLLDCFKKMPDISLTIVGEGSLKEKLKSIASDNVKFLGHIPNDKISEIYLEHDIFILPSLSEPWGLVIDEALYYKLPVIVSKYVGCASELVEQKSNGIIIDEFTIKDMTLAIQDISTRYLEYKNNISKVNFFNRDIEQVNAYKRGIQ